MIMLIISKICMYCCAVKMYIYTLPNFFFKIKIKIFGHYFEVLKY